MESEQRGVRRQLAYGAVGLGCAVLAVWAQWGGLLLVVAGRVVPGWWVSCVLYLAALVLMRAGDTPEPALRADEGDATAGPGRPAADRPAGKRRAVPYRVLLLAKVAAALSIALGALGDLTQEADYRVLEPGSPQGCRVVVRETSFLVAGGGDVYEVGVMGLGLKVGSWSSDDGYRPFRSSTYELDWGREGDALTFSGTRGDPVLWSDVEPIDC